MCYFCVKVWCLAISKSGDMLVSGTFRSIKGSVEALLRLC